MNIIKPTVELWLQKDAIAHVAKCARICYKKETGNNVALYERLKHSNHLSMFRHESIYAIIPNHDRNLRDNALYYINCPYINIHVFNGYTFVSTNGQFVIEHIDEPFIKLVRQYSVTANEFIDDKFCRAITLPMLRYTFKVTTQISTSRELNRVSPNNIAEQSTRYVYENGTLCCPHWLDYDLANNIQNLVARDGDKVLMDNDNNKAYIYLKDCAKSFASYKVLVDECKMNRQDARGVLPIDTATVCAYTYSVSQWRDIIDLRYHGKTGAPHPNTKIIASMIREELLEFGYDL